MLRFLGLQRWKSACAGGTHESELYVRCYRLVRCFDKCLFNLGGSKECNTGPSVLGGSPLGGATGVTPDGSPVAGAATGGSPEAGAATGGSPEAGAAAGGSPLAGAATGGSPLAGAAAGGAPKGGAATGGAATGGAATGGSATSDTTSTDPNNPIECSRTLRETKDPNAPKDPNDPTCGGYAPLSIFFTMKEENGIPDIESTTHWDFDSDKGEFEKLKDPDPLTPANGRRFASGFLAAHVFEKPGTYTVKATRYYANGEKKVWTRQVKILSLDGWTTIYVTLEDAGPSTTDITLSNYKLPFRTTLQNAFEKLAKAKTRVRIRKPTAPDTIFQIDHGVSGSAPGPVLVDSYDPTALDNFYNKVKDSKVDDPNDPSTSDDINAPTIKNMTKAADWGTIMLGDDWRLMNLKIAATGTPGRIEAERRPGAAGFIAGKGLILRVEQHDLHGSWLQLSGRYNTVAECKIYNVSSGGWMGSDHTEDNTYGAAIGNWVYNMTSDDPQHTFRVQSASKVFIAYNEFGPKSFVNYDGITIRGNTDRVVIYRNIIHDWVTAVWPAVRDLNDEKQKYVALESNLFIGGDNAWAAIEIRAHDVVVRNNITINYAVGVRIENDAVVGPSQNIKVYNNTFINNNEGGLDEFAGLEVGDGCTFEDYNNIYWAGAKTSQPQFMRTVVKTIKPDDYWRLGDKKSDYNLFYGTTARWSGDGPALLFGTRTLNQWKTDIKLDANSYIENMNLASVSLPDFTTLSKPWDPPEELAKPDGKAAHVSQCKAVPNVALDFHGRLRTPGQCGAVGF